MQKMKKVVICTISDLVNQLEKGLVDINNSFAILSLSKELSRKDAGIISQMDHCACQYADVDFDFFNEGLSMEAGKGISQDLIRRAPSTRNWFFVSDEGHRRSAAICCAFLAYLGCREELKIWEETEVNTSVYGRIRHCLNIPISKDDFNLRMHINYAVCQTKSKEWYFEAYVRSTKDYTRGNETKRVRSGKEIRMLFQAVDRSLDQVINQLGEIIEAETELGYFDAEGES